MVNIIENILDAALIKGVVSFAFAAFGFLFGEMYREAVMAIVMLFCLDTISGVAAAAREGEPISSYKFINSLKKFIIFTIAISSGHFADSSVMSFQPFIQPIVIGFVGMTEFISIIENINRLGYKTPKGLIKLIRGKRDDLVK